MKERDVFAKNAVWKMADSLAAKGISLIISIILARILMPADYGIITLTGVFINFSIILVQSGLGTALVRSEKLDEEDCSNAFVFSFMVALICYLVFYVAAGPLSNYYNEPVLKSVIRVQMLSLFICSLSTK